MGDGTVLKTEECGFPCCAIASSSGEADDVNCFINTRWHFIAI